MKKDQLTLEIRRLQEKITQYQNNLDQLKKELDHVFKQEQERQQYISSKEILDLIYESIGKEGNMSMIKRWADEGYLGEVVDEKDKFWALRSKQGKKRFLYPKKNVFQFLLEKGYIRPKFEVLDRVTVSETNVGIIVNSCLKEEYFYYTVQLEETREILNEIRETDIKQQEIGGCVMNEGENQAEQ